MAKPDPEKADADKANLVMLEVLAVIQRHYGKAEFAAVLRTPLGGMVTFHETPTDPVELFKLGLVLELGLGGQPDIQHFTPKGGNGAPN